jgi:hypothetical protein
MYGSTKLQKIRLSPTKTSIFTQNEVSDIMIQTRNRVGSDINQCHPYSTHFLKHTLALLKYRNEIFLCILKYRDLTMWCLKTKVSMQRESVSSLSRVSTLTES